jgi:hypothetical protein
MLTGAARTTLTPPRGDLAFKAESLLSILGLDFEAGFTLVVSLFGRILKSNATLAGIRA